ncbi:MAG TPA: FkbM family methyltransferase [Bryobacteraceae bacterium]|jgi:FkbM family methyltransferase
MFRSPAKNDGAKHSRGRLARLTIGALAGLVVLGSTFLITNALNPAGTMRAVLRAGSEWEKYWPLNKGHYAPDRVVALLYSTGIAKPVQAEVWPGAIFELDARDLVARSILETGSWEPPVTQAATEILKKDAVMIDVGAHIGYYSILASKAVGPGGKVVAVEPNPSTLRRLYKNLQLSNASNVVVEEVANTDRETMLQFFESSFSNSGMSSLSEANAIRAPGHSVVTTTVRGRPLDAIVRELGLRRVDLVKIDVEGAEVQVLKGMRETLTKLHPVLLVEMDAEQLANMGTSIEQLRALLIDSGYVVARRLDNINFEWVHGTT